jgi:acyl carrier protein
MERNALITAILRIFAERFEIENPGLDDNLRDSFEFDSIDAVELLHEIEVLLGTRLTRAEKKNAMEIRTINQIADYVKALQADRSAAGPGDSAERLTSQES